MAPKFTMTLSNEDYATIMSAAEKAGVTIQQYLRIVGLQAAQSGVATVAKTSADDLFEAIERVLLQTQGIANIVTACAGESAIAAAGVRQLIREQHPGSFEPVKRHGLKFKQRIIGHWSRVLELSR